LFLNVSCEKEAELAKTKSPMAKVVKVGFVMILFFCV